MKQTIIHTEYILLGQFLKFIGIVENGAECKLYLLENDIKVNNITEIRRGRKLYPGDVISINKEEYKIYNN